MSSSRLNETLVKNQTSLLEGWLVELKKTARADLINEADLKKEADEFLRTLVNGIQRNDLSQSKDFLASLSRSRNARGFSTSETASFILSLKKPVFSALQKEFKDAETLASEIWNATETLDQLALITTEAYQKSREEVISRQQADMLELSTPVVELWDNILALPMIGTLDSSRTQVVMETLLLRIVETGSEIAIIDITGVPTVDTLVAQHLLKTVTAARLMGAECIISGIRPQIAATIVHLGVDLGNIITKASLADAFKLALVKTGQSISHKRG